MPPKLLIPSVQTVLNRKCTIHLSTACHVTSPFSDFRRVFSLDEFSLKVDILTMSFPRVNPRLLHPIHSPARIPHIRCIRTTPLTFAKEENQGWSIRNAYLAGESGVKKFSKRVMVLANRNLRKKQGELRIPLVPKVGDNEKLVPLPDAPKINEKIRENRENWTEEELVEDRELQLREEKIEEFSLERKKVKGLSSKEREQKWLAHAERGEEVPDNIVYPRDVIGKRFRKEKVKYTVKLYGISLELLMV